MPIRPATGSKVALQGQAGSFFKMLNQLDCTLALSIDEAHSIMIGPSVGAATMSALVLPELNDLSAQDFLIALGSAHGVPGRVIPLEDEGTDLICGVVALNAATFEVIGILEVTAGVEEIYDLQILPGTRRPDIRSMEQRREHHAIELPNEAFWATEPKGPE